MRNLHIIDTLAPFAIHNNRETINWSKIDFATLETNHRLSSSTRKKIIERFEQYIVQVTRLGYDSISIDDLAHLASFDFYNSSLRQLLRDYHTLYKKLFAIAKRHDVKIFVNTDYLFFNEDIHDHLKKDGSSPLGFYRMLLEQVFTAFPEVDGVILRVGENDGKDVENTFLSQILLKTPAQANELLAQVLPIFERLGKTLIFRTWTVGVYEIGDLIWNKATYDTVFASIKSDALVISMKFGDTDFMRYLHLNPLFNHGEHKKIIELQTRREWEGMGEFPSFVGWDYYKYLQQLANNQTIVGFHIWCQTGGWAKRTWSTTTYFDDRAFWNELNTEVTIDIAKHGLSVEKAIERFCKSRNIRNAESFTKLLHLSDAAILKGIYLPAIGEKPLYFRRTRIPPLTWLTWDKVHLPPIVAYLHQLLIPSPQRTIQSADEAVTAAREMLKIAHDVALPPHIYQSLEFELDTLILFADLKRYMFNFLTQEEVQLLNHEVQTYEKRYPQHYSISPLKPLKSASPLLRILLGLITRDTAPYRLRDKLAFKTSRFQAWIVRQYLRRAKSHLANQSMGFEAFFK